MDKDITIYDNERRYIFTNWTNFDFVGTWGGQDTLVKSGQSIELPQYKAFHFCKHLVNREMEKNDRVAVDSPEGRKPYEDKTIAEITAGTDSPALSKIKEKIREEIKNEEEGKVEEEVKEETKEETKEFEDIKEVKPKRSKKVK